MKSHPAYPLFKEFFIVAIIATALSSGTLFFSLGNINGHIMDVNSIHVLDIFRGERNIAITLALVLGMGCVGIHAVLYMRQIAKLTSEPKALVWIHACVLRAVIYEVLLVLSGIVAVLTFAGSFIL